MRKTGVAVVLLCVHWVASDTDDVPIFVEVVCQGWSC